MSFSVRLLLGSALLLAGCSNADPANSNGNNNPNPPSLPGGTPAATASVDVEDLYSPTSVLLAAGGPVRNALNSRSVTFPTTGDYKYFCTVHGVASYYSARDMVGTIFVR